MIPGIEVLAQETIHAQVGDAVLAIIIGGILAIGIFIAGIIAICDNEAIMLIPFSVILILAALFITAGISELNQKPYEQYDVLIGDEVPIKEFNNRYEIIEQRGEIYTIKERD